MVLVQNWPFFHFFLGKYRQGKCILRYSGTKNTFLGYKIQKFIKSKNWHFSKRDNTWFSSKNGHFPTFFFRHYRPGKCLLLYSRTKNTFLGYKNIKFKKSKNWHFSKGVNPWFWSKNGDFSNIFFSQYRPGKCLWPYFTKKKQPF